MNPLTLYREAFANALALRWRVTRSEEDFRAAKKELEMFTDPPHQQKLAIVLLNHGDFDEAQNVLSEALSAGEPVTQFVIIDGHLRAGRIDAARQLLLCIAADDLPNRFRLPYAVAYSHVALACDDPEMKKLAAAKLRELSLAGTQMARHVNDLLHVLENHSAKGGADMLSRLRDRLMG